jgi:hypothetical protein
MADYTDEQILQANQGRIEIGDYVVFKGNLVLKWVSQDVNKVNIMYEKFMPGPPQTTEEIMIVEDINSSSNNVNSYTWFVPFSGNPQYEYPIYRIKIVSTQSNNIVAYSNPFKVSVNMSGIINNEEQLPLYDPNTIVTD